MAIRKREIEERGVDGDSGSDGSTDLSILAARQGVKPVERIEDLFGEFWPVDEPVDDFIAAYRESRRDGSR